MLSLPSIPFTATQSDIGERPAAVVVEEEAARHAPSSLVDPLPNI